MKFFRKYSIFHCTSKEVRAHDCFIFILKHEDHWSVKVMRQILNVGETGYYKFKRNLDKPSKATIY